MPESRDAQADISYIRTHVDNLERMVKFQIASNPASREAVKQILLARKGSAELYLALAEPKTQGELQAALKLSAGTVSMVLKHLFEAGLLVKVPSPTNPKAAAYAWSDYEQILKVSKIAQQLLRANRSQATKQASRRAPTVSDNGSLESGRVADEGESS